MQVTPMTIDQHGGIFAFTQKVQSLALQWLEDDPMQRLPRIWDVLQEIPTCDQPEDRVVLAVIVSRIAEGFFQPTKHRGVSVDARLRRAHVSDVHTIRALDYILREFARSNLNLRTVADKCGLSVPHLCHLLSISTSHGFRTHLGGVRVLYAAYLLAHTCLSIQEVANQSGHTSTSALDREFRNRIRMTPGEFRRWGT